MISDNREVPPQTQVDTQAQDLCTSGTAAATASTQAYWIAVPALLSMAEVCQYFDREPRTISRWVKVGHLTAVRVGRAMCFSRDDVLTCLLRLGVASTTEDQDPDDQPPADRGNTAAVSLPSDEDCQGEGLPVLISTRELCRLSDCTDRTLRNWERSGRLRPIRIGGAVFYRLDAAVRL